MKVRNEIVAMYGLIGSEPLRPLVGWPCGDVRR